MSSGNYWVYPKGKSTPLLVSINSASNLSWLWGLDRVMTKRPREKGVFLHDLCYFDVCKQHYTVIQVFGEYNSLRRYKTR
jgi:hypothetical protein